MEEKKTSNCNTFLQKNLIFFFGFKMTNTGTRASNCCELSDGGGINSLNARILVPNRLEVEGGQSHIIVLNARTFTYYNQGSYSIVYKSKLKSTAIMTWIIRQHYAECKRRSDLRFSSSRIRHNPSSLSLRRTSSVSSSSAIRIETASCCSRPRCFDWYLKGKFRTMWRVEQFTGFDHSKLVLKRNLYCPLAYRASGLNEFTGGRG